MKGKVCNLFICPCTRKQCQTKISHDLSFSKEESILKKDGSTSPVLRSASLIYLKGKECIFETVIDISKRKKAEDLIIKTQHLESIATLASGIAHEFNNINQIMNGTIDVFFLDNNDNDVPPHVKESLSTIKSMIERGAIITNDLMIFTSDTNDGSSNISPLEIIKEVLFDFREDIEEFDITIENNIPEDLYIYANQSEIKSVFVNLLSNAIHALIDTEKRIISICYTNLKDGNVEIFIKDNGCGIEEYNLNKIFDPFFSTKGVYAESGSSQSAFESRGLGLSVCHTILEKHHKGKIRIYSEPGKGTKVSFSLPQMQ